MILSQIKLPLKVRFHHSRAGWRKYAQKAGEFRQKREGWHVCNKASMQAPPVTDSFRTLPLSH